MTMKKVFLIYLLTAGAAFFPMLARGQNPMRNTLVYSVSLASENPLRKQVFSDIAIFNCLIGQAKTCRCALSRRYQSSKETLFFLGRPILFQKPGKLALKGVNNGEERKIEGPGATFGIWDCGDFEETGKYLDEPIGSKKGISYVPSKENGRPLFRLAPRNNDYCNTLTKTSFKGRSFLFSKPGDTTLSTALHNKGSE
jgi:hypothetical protein